jgi:hypothetical protein
MRTEASTQETGTSGTRRSVVLLSLALGTALAAMVALVGTAREAQAATRELMERSPS